MDESDTALNFGEEEEISKRGNRLIHPVAVFFHVFFRASALVAYLLCGLFSSSFITNFVVIILLLCMDFWTVKNITGRLLVGLRWWNYVDENGESRWIFESRKGSGTLRMSAAESRIFWLSLIISQILWFVFLFAAVFQLSLKWFMVVMVGFIMNGANLYGYIRCKVGAKKNLRTVATGFLTTQMLKNLLSSSTSSTAASSGDKSESTAGNY
ncbi:Golgi apparatus membrane protein tvp23 homolog [Plakobranchus ocellatus]|uniref:Golgi apparatus membrane protein TVP23 homolog n=1 Tax=Plakobranchus ocellatus TaxID=259542 RepID=A0AAV3Y760_9GAST|nr:Golgi apparatus membrane protein tvp23 homolog [Plakobranchus ocellatus]